MITVFLCSDHAVLVDDRHDRCIFCTVPETHPGSVCRICKLKKNVVNSSHSKRGNYEETGQGFAGFIFYHQSQAPGLTEMPSCWQVHDCCCP